MNYNYILDNFFNLNNKVWKQLSQLSNVDISVSMQTHINNIYLRSKERGLNLQKDYIKKILIAYNYALGRYHYKTRALLINDIVVGKRINLRDYII